MRPIPGAVLPTEIILFLRRDPGLLQNRRAFIVIQRIVKHFDRIGYVPRLQEPNPRLAIIIDNIVMNATARATINAIAIAPGDLRHPILRNQVIRICPQGFCMRRIGHNRRPPGVELCVMNIIVQDGDSQGPWF